MVGGLGIESKFDEIQQSDNDLIILDFHHDHNHIVYPDHRHGYSLCPEGWEDRKSKFTLINIAPEGVTGLLDNGWRFYIPFFPTDAYLEWTLLNAIYNHSTKGTLNSFLDYHFDNAIVSPQKFFDYLTDFTKRRLQLDMSVNIKPVRIILEWLRSRSANFVEIDEWFAESSHMALSTPVEQPSQKSESDIKLQWNGTNDSLYDLFAQLSLVIDP